MKLVRKKDIYTGDIYESLTEGKKIYGIFLKKLFIGDIMPEGILVKENAKLLKLKHRDVYIDIEKLNNKDLLYINFYEEHKYLHDFISAFLKEPKTNYLCYNTPSRGELFVKNVKRYCDLDEDKKISLKKARKL